MVFLIIIMGGFLIMIGLFFVERWLPLLGAIFTGDSKSLEDDILHSGICENKQGDWGTKYKRRAEELKKKRESFWGIEEYKPIPIQQQPRVYVRREPVDPEMQNLMRELYEDC